MIGSHHEYRWFQMVAKRFGISTLHSYQTYILTIPTKHVITKRTNILQ